MGGLLGCSTTITSYKGTPPPSLLHPMVIPKVELVEGEVLYTRVVEAYLASVNEIVKGNKQLQSLKEWFEEMNKVR